jgi:hypothetical protein
MPALNTILNFLVANVIQFIQNIIIAMCSEYETY